MENGYNGWTNRATWNVALWVDNDQDTYTWRMEVQPSTAATCKAFGEMVFGHKTPDGCLLANVDWTEIAEAWAADYEAHAEDVGECLLCGVLFENDHKCEDE